MREKGYSGAGKGVQYPQIKTTGDTMAGKRKQLDVTQILALAKNGHTNEEIGALLGCSADTLERNYRSVLRAGKGQMIKGLRAAQYKAAESGNVQMLIWMGKQFLGQKDQQDITSGGEPIVVKNLYGVNMKDI